MRCCNGWHAAPGDDAATPVDAGNIALLQLSGGSTGIPKLIPRTHDDYLLNARACARVAGFDANTVLLAVLPLGHNYNLASPGMLGGPPQADPVPSPELP